MHVEKSAVFSPNKLFRYELWRWWDKLKPFVLFIGLNPSTADDKKDDPTIRRCIGFAQNWGFGGLCMVNLFAIRATNPRIMMNAFDPVGIDNDEHLIMLSDKASKIVAAWGISGGHRNRDKEVMSFIPDLHCLGITREGYPKHPLYISRDTELEVYDPLGVENEVSNSRFQRI